MARLRVCALEDLPWCSSWVSRCCLTDAEGRRRANKTVPWLHGYVFCQIKGKKELRRTMGCNHTQTCWGFTHRGLVLFLSRAGLMPAVPSVSCASLDQQSGKEVGKGKEEIDVAYCCGFPLGLIQRSVNGRCPLRLARHWTGPTPSWGTVFCEMQNRHSMDSAAIGFIST